MKAASLAAPGSIEVVERPEPTPGPGEVLLRVAFCGICGSDLHEFAVSSPPRLAGILDAVMGHEITGTVAATGEGVSVEFRGRPVAVNPSAPCGACSYCTSGAPNLCRTAFFGGVGYGRPGGYAEFVCARADQLLPLPDPRFLRPAALAEPLAVALHLLNRIRFRAGESILVTGAGPIGLLTVLAAKRAGAGLVAVSEPAEHRREEASVLGADAVLDPAETDVQAAVLEATGGTGADAAAECSGASPAIDACLASVRSGGRIAVAGVTDQPHAVDLFHLLTTEKELVGCLGYTAEFQQAVKELIAGTIDISPLVSEVPLAAVPGIFAEHTAGRSRHHKVLVRP